MTDKAYEINQKISRGVHARVKELKRGGALGMVFLSKKRNAELSALKTSSFFQEMTLVEDREDRTLFKKPLNSMADAEAFLASVISEANAVGVGEASLITPARVLTYSSTRSNSGS